MRLHGETCRSMSNSLTLLTAPTIPVDPGGGAMRSSPHEQARRCRGSSVDPLSRVDEALELL